MRGAPKIGIDIARSVGKGYAERSYQFLRLTMYRYWTGLFRGVVDERR